LVQLIYSELKTNTDPPSLERKKQALLSWNPVKCLIDATA